MEKSHPHVTAGFYNITTVKLFQEFLESSTNDISEKRALCLVGKRVPSHLRRWGSRVVLRAVDSEVSSHRGVL